jgi:tetratricopeptide (TPR) repeat protein
MIVLDTPTMTPPPPPPASEDMPSVAPPRWLDALAAIPCVLAGLTVVVVVILVLRGRPIEAEYARDFERDSRRGNFQSALICISRLVEMNPDRPDLRMYLAFALSKVGDNEQAEAVLRALAPSDRLGYPPAHLALAKAVLNDWSRLRGHSRDAEAHLLRYIQGEPSNEGKRLGQAKLGELYVLAGRYHDALPLLEATAGHEPAQILALAKTYQAVDDHRKADRHFQSAAREARMRLEQSPDDQSVRLVLVEACLMLQDFPAVMGALERGATLSGDPSFRKKMADVCGVWAASLSRDILTETDPARKKALSEQAFTKIEEGLRYDPLNQTLMERIGQVLQGGGEEAERIRTMLQRQLVTGKGLVLAHNCLGTDAFARGRPAEARNHWEQAYELDRSNPLTANNLAYALAFTEPFDVDRGLTMIDYALVGRPGEPLLHGTRGEILTKLQRWKEAAAELEIALSGGQDSAGIHSALAEAYDHLQMPDVAEAHRKAAAERSPKAKAS